MKDYSKSIVYMKQEKVKHTAPHQMPYADVIEAMERFTPREPVINGKYMYCPRCGVKQKFSGRVKRVLKRKNGMGICALCEQHIQLKKSKEENKKWSHMCFAKILNLPYLKKP